MKSALFPLSAHLLPGGRMALRIFEPRYVRMVKEACARNSGFVMCMLNSRGNKDLNQHIYPIGTYANVVDFDVLDDGLLGIKVAGLYAVRVSNIETQYDGLRVGDVEQIEPWQCAFTAEQISPMPNRLKEIFEKYAELNAIYESKNFDDPVWVMHRWLELLPVDAKQKQHFLMQKDCDKLLNYLSTLVQ